MTASTITRADKIAAMKRMEQLPSRKSRTGDPRAAKIAAAKALRKNMLAKSTTNLAITPGGRIGDASPLGKKGSKRKLSNYEREIAHALMRKRGMPKQKAIRMARGLTNKAAKTGVWGRKGKASAPVIAGAAASVAQRKSFANGKGRDIDFANALFDQVTTDLAARWKHGYIPLNAEAVAEKEHRKRGGGAGGKAAAKVAAAQPGGKTPAQIERARLSGTVGGKSVLKTHGNHGAEKPAHTRYHSEATKASMSREDLRAHAQAHTAAAGRARTEESKRKHLKEAQSSMDHVLNKTSGSRSTKSRTSERKPPTTKTARPKSKTSASEARNAREKQDLQHVAPPEATAENDGMTHMWSTHDRHGPDGKLIQQSAGETTAPVPLPRHVHEGETPSHQIKTSPKLQKMSAKDLSSELKAANKLPAGSAKTRRLNALNKEKARRVQLVKEANRAAYEAKKFVDKSWGDGRAPLHVGKFLGTLMRIFPHIKSKLPALRDEAGKVKGAETIKVIIDESIRQFARVVAGPLITSGFLALGLQIFGHNAGG